jgi:hypothetical protein
MLRWLHNFLSRISSIGTPIGSIGLREPREEQSPIVLPTSDEIESINDNKARYERRRASRSAFRALLVVAIVATVVALYSFGERALREISDFIAKITGE